MNLRINSLKLFVDLAESGSFSVTAGQHGITQSAVSQQISGLEEQFATRLVERSRRRFRLTPAGEAVFQTASEVLQSVERLKLRMMDLSRNLSGELMVSTTCNIGVEWLFQLMQELERQESQIRLKAVYQTANLIYADIAGNVADLAIMASPREDERFETVTIAEEAFCFVAAPAACLGNELSDIAPFITYAPDGATAQMVIQAVESTGRPITPAFRFEHPDSVVKAILAVGGFSCLPLEAVQEALSDGNLVEVFPDRPAPIRKIAAVFHKDRVQQPLIKAMRALIESFAKKKRVDGSNLAKFSPAAVE